MILPLTAKFPKTEVVVELTDNWGTLPTYTVKESPMYLNKTPGPTISLIIPPALTIKFWALFITKLWVLAK